MLERELHVLERTSELNLANESLRVEGVERQMAMSALREASEAFRDTQHMLQLVMNHIPQAIFWKDRESSYLGANHRLALDAGFDSTEKLIGQNDFDMPWAEEADLYRADDRFVMETDTAKLNIEESLTKADGSTVWIRTNKVPLHDNESQVVGVLCSYEDITQQKLAEVALLEAKREAEAANLAKSEFLSRMSHELRTPLNAILGFGQILERQDLTPLGKESTGYILKGGHHLLDLINEILDIARVEAGRLEISLEPTALNDIIPEACMLIRPLAEERGIQLRYELGELEHSYILADSRRLKQVLINLLSNAIKYNREAGQVEILCSNDSDAHTIIAICDTGPGISPHDLPKLFTPFERLNAAESEIEGTGLGLVLSQRLVTAMGGTLSVQSSPGEGTTFTIELPNAAAPPAQNTKQSLQSTRETENGENTQRYSLLCIEDNPSNLRLLEVILHDRPEIHLISAIQGRIGLELARQHEPDLILLDLHLPDIHGKEVLTRLQQSAITRDIPVIVVSADATPNQIERLLSAGAHAYLTKPLDVDLFHKTLNKFLTRGAGNRHTLKNNEEPA